MLALDDVASLAWIGGWRFGETRPGDVHPEGTIGQRADLADALADQLRLQRAAADHAEPASVGDGRHQLRRRGRAALVPAHTSLDDRVLDAEQVAERGA